MMLSFISKRFGEMAVALLLMSVVVFLLGRMTGDPVALLLSDYSTPQDRARVERELGLDQPLVEQYGAFIVNVFKGELGNSIMGDQSPAAELILERFPASLQLAGVALLISFLIGVPLGVVAATHRGKTLDFAARLVALIGQSVPIFWLGIMLMYLFSVRLHLLPTSGYGTAAHFVLPAATMSLFTIAAVTRLVRASMVDILNAEYIKLARIKGLPESVVIWKHALRNSLIPVLTFMGSFFANMITGAVVIETVFVWPGIGRLAYEAILNRDFPVIQAVVLFMTALFIGANLVVDLLYAWVDPRIRYGRR